MYVTTGLEERRSVVSVCGGASGAAAAAKTLMSLSAAASIAVRMKSLL